MDDRIDKLQLQMLERRKSFGNGWKGKKDSLIMERKRIDYSKKRALITVRH